MNVHFPQDELARSEAYNLGRISREGNGQLSLLTLLSIDRSCRQCSSWANLSRRSEPCRLFSRPVPALSPRCPLSLHAVVFVLPWRISILCPAVFPCTVLFLVAPCSSFSCVLSFLLVTCPFFLCRVVYSRALSFFLASCRFSSHLLLFCSCTVVFPCTLPFLSYVFSSFHAQSQFDQKSATSSWGPVALHSRPRTREFLQYVCTVCYHSDLTV